MSRTHALRPALAVTTLEDRVTPALIAVADTYSVSPGRVLTVQQNQGLLQNDIDTNAAGVATGRVLVVSTTPVAGPTFVGSNTPLLAGSLTVNPNGSFTFLAPSDVPAGATAVTFTYQVSEQGTGGATAFGTVTINLLANSTKLIATGADAGGGPHVRVYVAGTNVLKYNFFPYETTFTGGVRVAVGDINGDGVDDIVTVPESGGAVRVRAFSGADGSPLLDQFVFNTAFRGGGYVAIGDVNGDGRKDIIVGAGEGGGPRVTVLSFVAPALGTTSVGTSTVLADFFAYDTGLRSGVRVAAGDLTRAGRDFIVTAPGAGGGPQINVFDGRRVSGRTPTPAALQTFFAGDSADRGGVYLAVGDLRGDGRFDIITGTGAGTGVVSVYDGRTNGLVRSFTPATDLTPTGGTQLGAVIPAGGSTANGSLLSPAQVPGTLVPAAATAGIAGQSAGGVRVAATDANGDGLDDIVTATGPGLVSKVSVYDTKTQTFLNSLQPYSATFLGGVNVAASPRPQSVLPGTFVGL